MVLNLKSKHLINVINDYDMDNMKTVRCWKKKCAKIGCSGWAYTTSSKYCVKHKEKR
jgi:hypothetical protein